MKDKNGFERSIVCMLVRRDHLEWKATFAAFADGETERYTPKVSLAFFVFEIRRIRETWTKRTGGQSHSKLTCR
jgi:hypothetical protein